MLLPRMAVVSIASLSNGSQSWPVPQICPPVQKFIKRLICHGLNLGLQSYEHFESPAHDVSVDGQSSLLYTQMT